ncbi:methyltransferase [Nocardia aurantia]|uniref:Release factor glutamine methyltransferase n=1 Tax=Nocardia aurantia TaxID=2585199 RepID=A0A7K0DQ02_9NOCA|nr:methyltransferase [Nocardia aurantia]MQY27781.1 Release factor glutamine methyltransferase [Nocardia aurantia]
MIVFRAPGVYRPQSDTEMLLRAVGAAVPEGGRVLDVGTGSGALTVAALRSGAGRVTAMDISRRALLSARLNSLRWWGRVELLHGDIRLVHPRGRYDLVLANPPYVPACAADDIRRDARAWAAGPTGRSVLDPLCRLLPRLLRESGTGLIVQSALADPDRTVEMLTDGGLDAAVAARSTIAFGPVLRSRSKWLQATGLIEPGQRAEELVVIRAGHAR